MTIDAERRAGELLRLAQAGDQAAYAALLEIVATAARAFARARLGAVPWLDDVVQETLLAVHRARHTYDVRRPFAPWFYAIAANRLIDVVRRERRVATREIATDLLPDAPARAGPAAGEIDVEAVRAAVAALPGRQRQIIEALKFEDHSVREIAGELRMSPSAVKVAAHRGYKALRRLLGGAQRAHR
jgi:RNA polymerase sigma-70 factor (ECF subfamily)